MTDDVRKLLGGYATDTLSPDERRLLFEEALHDDELFAALSDEQALKDLLEDSAVRSQLLRATEEPRFSVAGAFREWFERPKSRALVATGVVLLTVIGFREFRPQVERSTTQVAEVREQVRAPEMPSAAPVAAPPAIQSSPRKSRPRPEPEKKMELDTIDSAVAVGPQSLALRQEADFAPAPLRYELLLRAPDGEFRPVPGSHEFSVGDVIRLRVTSAKAGAVAVSPAGRQTVSAPVRENEPITLPANGGITIAAGTDKLSLAFAAPGSDLTSARGAATSSFTMTELAKARQAPAPSLTIEIPIRQRK